MITKNLFYFHFVNLQNFFYFFLSLKFIERKEKKSGDVNLTQEKKKKHYNIKGVSTVVPNI